MNKALATLILASLLISILPLNVAADDTEDIPTNAVATGVHDSLVAALTQADLVTTLQGQGPFTVFAPTDDAFAAAGIDLSTFDTDEENATLESILLYHVVPGTVMSTDITDGMVATTANGENLTINIVNGSVMINQGATVTTPDVVASNGVIHVIDQVLMPPSTEPAGPPGEICYNVMTHMIVAGADQATCDAFMYLENYSMNGQEITGCYNSITHAVSNLSQAVCESYMWTPSVDIAMTAGATGIHTSLVAALAQANLVTTLQGVGPFTVFAPTDEAFTAAGINLDDFTTAAEIATLADILLYHVVSAQVGAADVTDGMVAAAVNGDNLSFTVVDGAVTVNGANVVLADVPASNGVIHVIDAVLMPPAAPAGPPGEICYNVMTHMIVAGADQATCDAFMYLENYSMNGQEITGCYNSITHAVSNLSQAVCESYMWTPSVDIAMTAGATGIHTSLVAALAQANLVTTLQGVGPFTVFAPTDEAFTAAGINLDDFTTAAEIATLADILLYHVVSAQVGAADVTDGMVAAAVNGDNLSFTVVDGAVTVNGANVVLADVPASNGVIHVIDAVLMPPADTVDEPVLPDCDVTVRIAPSGLKFSPSEVTINVGQTACWQWENESMAHNVRQVDGDQSTTYAANGITSGVAATTVDFRYTFEEDNTTFYYACEPHLASNMFGKVIVGDGGVETTPEPVTPVDDDDEESVPGFLMLMTTFALAGAALFVARSSK